MALEFVSLNKCQIVAGNSIRRVAAAHNNARTAAATRAFGDGGRSCCSSSDSSNSDVFAGCLAVDAENSRVKVLCTRPQNNLHTRYASQCARLTFFTVCS